MRALLIFSTLVLATQILPAQARDINFTSCDEVLSPEVRNLNELLIQKLEHLWSVNLFTPDTYARILNSTKLDLPNFGQILLNDHERTTLANNHYSISEIAQGLDTYFSNNSKFVQMQSLKAWATDKVAQKQNELQEQPRILEKVNNLLNVYSIIQKTFASDTTDSVKKRLLNQIDVDTLNTSDLLQIHDWIREAANEIPLIVLTKLDQTKLVQRLIELKEIDVNETGTFSGYALRTAVDHARIEILESLILHPNIQLNNQSTYGNTAILSAASGGNAQVFRLLMSHPSVDINVKNDEGITPLIWLAGNGHSESLKLMLERPDIQVNEADKDGQTALIKASDRGHLDVVRLLLNRPEILVNLKSNDNLPALLHAAEGNHNNVIELLLERPELDINVIDGDGNTALSIAASNGSNIVVKTLLNHPEFSRNKINHHGQSAFVLAATNGRTETVKLMLSRPDIVINVEPFLFGSPNQNSTKDEITKLIQYRLKHPNATAQELQDYYFPESAGQK